MRKYEKRDDKMLDVEVLEKCRRKNIVPNFLHSKLANHRLRSGEVYKDIQLKLLKEEIYHYKKEIRDLQFI